MLDPKRLRAIRKARGMSQLELAAALDGSPAQISKLESGKSDCSVTYLLRLAGALDVSPCELLPGQVSATLPLDAARVANDPMMPPALRRLAADSQLLARLSIPPIEPLEWAALATLSPPSPLTVQGYLRVLFVLRTETMV